MVTFILFLMSARGQKVSAAGTVIHLFFVYTAGDAYQGGVLAPNGDIHFVPFIRALVGQKISAAGVVSTYSLSLHRWWSRRICWWCFSA
jgi:hypothetical protein